MSQITKYLRLYAEKEIHYLSDFPASVHYSNVLVIPAYNEDVEFFLRFIGSKLCRQNILLILIINQPDSETNSTLQHSLTSAVIQSGSLLWEEKNLSLIQLQKASAQVLMVDRFSHGLCLPSKQAVGLARKIGADIATALISAGCIDSPWICSTDADVSLPDRYFTVLSDISHDTSAVTYDYHHTSYLHSNDRYIDDHHDKQQRELNKATQRYEQAMRYYVSGLDWAGSSFAFHTIGSAIAFRYNYYSMVRGFPKRDAAEDFYLLNKLAKQASVKKINSVTIKIKSRISNRVPFGTGVAVAKILALDDPDHNYFYYHPQVFVELKICLGAMNNLYQYKDNSESWFGGLSEASRFGLEQLKFQNLIVHIQHNISTEQQCLRHIVQWFDAFRTLKFIRFLQQKYYPAIALKQALIQCPFEVQ